MFRLFCLLIGYAIGCIQSAFIAGKVLGNIDIREHGSGNAGTTNAIRVLGMKAGVVVFLVDLSKVIIAYISCSLIFDGGGSFVSGSSFLPGIYAGIGAVIGHNFPAYLKFKGGKGIACTLGLMLCIDWKIALMAYAVGLVLLFVKWYISLSSLVTALLFPILLIVFGFEIEPILLCFGLCILAYVKHIPNIKRLLSGTENKFSLKSKKKAL